MLLMLSSLWGCATHSSAPDSLPDHPRTDFRVLTNIAYTPEEWPQTLYADLYLPDTNGKRATVLLVHGGGWERRSRKDMAWIARELASRGFAVMNVDYRFAPEYTFPAQLHDVQMAMRWLHTHGSEYRLDRSAISAFGFSSGAHLVALMALVASSDSPLNAPYGGNQTCPTAVVAGGIPSDLEAFESGRLIRQFLGGEQQEIPDIYRQASPVTHVTPSAPPFFLFHGGMDMLVPFAQAQRLQQALSASGVDNELYRMHLRGHLTSFLTAGSAVDKAADFLRRHSRSSADGS
ncbi:alpha/beta hydrolase [Marinobacter sp. NP-4(2019)]|nr:alpha/beta hydrolase [Marinobacter sp. NP-4(2019)]